MSRDALLHKLLTMSGNNSDTAVLAEGLLAVINILESELLLTQRRLRDAEYKATTAEKRLTEIYARNAKPGVRAR